MKGKKKGVLLVLMLMSVFMLLPLGASAAKLNMTTPLKYAKRGYKIIAWNKSDTSRAYVYQQANFKNGTYGSLEKGRRNRCQYEQGQLSDQKYEEQAAHLDSCLPA